jgi:putative transposase
MKITTPNPVQQQVNKPTTSEESKQSNIDLTQVKTVDDLLDKNGPLKQMFKETLEKILKTELTNHLGYSSHSKKGHHTGNSRNGTSQKKQKTSLGKTNIEIPRDRAGTFEPQIISKYQTHTNEIEYKIITMYSRGMTTRDIKKTISDIYGIDISQTSISDITNTILSSITEWQSRPLDTVYPFVFLDAIHYKVREDGRIVSKAVYIVLGIDCNGKKDILGIWIGESESSKFWLKVLIDLKNRGVEDILIACTDGLTGFEEALKSVFPKTLNQLCVIHQIRNSLKYIAHKDTKEFLIDLKKIYRANTREEAEKKLDDLDNKWAKKYPLVIKSWRLNWHRLSIYFDYPPQVRRTIYTTNLIEGFNRQLRKVTKNRSVFPNDNSVLKLIYLATQDIMQKWTKPLPNWAQTISQLSIYFGDRVKIDI